MTWPRAGAAVALVLSAVAATAAAERLARPVAAHGPGTRTFVGDAKLSALEVPGLVAPVALGRSLGGAVILDGATRRLVPIGQPTGPDARRADSTPPPWRVPVLADVGARGEDVSVLDVAGSSLHRVSGDGRPVARRSLLAVSAPLAGCVLPDGSAMLLTEGVEDALASVGPDGRVRWRRRLPWIEAQEAPALARQGFVVAAPDGRSCVVALAFGPGWAWVDRHGAVRRMGEWRDRGPPVAVRQVPGGTRLAGGVPVVHAATVRGDTLEVVAAGPTGMAMRSVDRVSLRTGAYLGSIRLPRAVSAIAAVDGGWLALAVRAGRAEPVRLRLRPRAVTRAP